MMIPPNFTYKNIELNIENSTFHFKQFYSESIVFGSFECFDSNKKAICALDKKPYNALFNHYPQLSFHSCHQTHSTNSIHVKTSNEKFNYYSNADGLYTQKKNQALFIKTADCIPLILFKKDFIAILHLGHKGLLNNFYEKFSKLKYIDLTKLNAYIGPSIHSCCFEVKEDFLKTNLNKNSITDEDILIKDQKYYLSLNKILINKLILSGIPSQNIYQSTDCTQCHKDYFSYRRNQTKNRISHLIFLR